MSKELEALKRMEYFVNEEMGIKTFKQSGWHIEGTDDYELVKEGLQRLEAIDNSNPSKALEDIFNIIYNLDCGTTYEQDKKLNDCREVLKQALIKAQEQENILNTLKSNMSIDYDSYDDGDECGTFEFVDFNGEALQFKDRETEKKIIDWLKKR